MDIARARAATVRLGGWTVALGAGALITYCGTGIAWATEDPSATSREVDTTARGESESGPEDRDDATKRRGARGLGETPDDPASTEDAEDENHDGSLSPDRFDEDATAEADELVEPPEMVSVPDEATGVQADPAEPATIVTPIIGTADSSGEVDDMAPEDPVATPALLTLRAPGRREADGDAQEATPPESSALPKTAEMAVAEVAPPEVPANWQELYTGKPSFVHEIVVAGLKIVQFVLKPFGGLLRFTSLKVPIFTDGFPPFHPWNVKITRTEFDGIPVWSLEPRNGGDEVVIALHGGSYEGQVNLFQWWAYTDMARDTGATVVVPLYELAPKGTATTEVPRTADFITHMIKLHGSDNVAVLGDSAGGGLALATTQELVRRGAVTPSRLVLLAPWLDVSMSDPRSAQIDDPLLDIPNLTRAGRAWAGDLDVSDPLASPLFGSLSGLPPMYVYSSSRDLLTVDTLRLRDRVLVENIPDVTFRLRRGLIHDYPLFPFLPDSVAERGNIYGDIYGDLPGVPTASPRETTMRTISTVRQGCDADTKNADMGQPCGPVSAPPAAAP